MPHGITWDTSRARKLWLEAIPLREIAERLGISRNALAKYAKKEWPDYKPNSNYSHTNLKQIRADPASYHVEDKPIPPKRYGYGERSLPPLTIESLPILEWHDG
jgi:transcriptional regulator with XRE-family HTH domain